MALLLGFSVHAITESKTYTVNISAVDHRNYILNGTDRNGSVNRDDPKFTVNNGDTIILILTHLIIRSI